MKKILKFHFTPIFPLTKMTSGGDGHFISQLYVNVLGRSANVGGQVSASIG